MNFFFIIITYSFTVLFYPYFYLLFFYLYIFFFLDSVINSLLHRYVFLFFCRLPLLYGLFGPYK